MAYTRAQFRDLIRQRLGWSATDTFVTDAELNNYINDGLSELHAFLVTVFRPGQWGTSTTTVTVPAGFNIVPLTSVPTFARLINVAMLYGGYQYPLQPGDPVVDIQSTMSTSWTPWNVHYYLRIDGTSSSTMALLFNRPTTVNQDLSVTYLQAAPVFAADGDTSWMGYDEYVVLDAMVKCRRKEEDDASDVERQKDVFEQRVRMHAEPLDMGRAATVQDVRAMDEVRNLDAQWWRRWA